jgi:hypothetical protein
MNNSYSQLIFIFPIHIAIYGVTWRRAEFSFVGALGSVCLGPPLGSWDVPTPPLPRDQFLAGLK